MNEQLNLKKYVRCLLFITDCGHEIGKFASISGTCFLIKYKGVYYAITAKHTLRDLRRIDDLKILLNPYAKNEKQQHRTIKFESAFSYNGDTGTMDYDNDCDDICILKVHHEEPSSLLDPFFFPYSELSYKNFTQSSQLIIMGFPTEAQDIGDGTKRGSFGAIHLTCSSYMKDSLFDYKFRVMVANNKIKGFDGFSGSPIFCILNDGTEKISGIVIRGTAESGILHCLDIRLFEAAILLRERKPYMISNNIF